MKEKRINNNSKKTKKSWFFKILIQIVLGFFDVCMAIFLLAFLTFIYFYTNTPNIKDIRNIKISEASTIYDSSGEHILYKIFGEENRKIIPHKEIPDTARVTAIASEDDGFYHHFGIDLKSLLRAIKTNIENDSIQQGASTITQQLARSLFLTREKTITRKAKEAILAIKLERSFSKDEILDMYLNQIPYGANAYGIQAAAQTYFGKDAKDLTLDEAALLAVLPNAPTFYFPYGENDERLFKKQRFILERLKKLKLADPEEISQALAINTFEKLKPLSKDIKAPHFVMYVIEKLEGEYGRDLMEKGGLKITTTLDWEKQQLAEEILKNSKNHLNNYGASNASIVAVEPTSGKILAMVGSLDYFDKNIDGEVNVATRVRQPGSSFKPVVYAKAFEKGLQPESMIYDVRTNFGPDGSGRSYIPQNYNGKFNGLISMRQALAMSLNIPAVKTLYIAGISDTIELARRLGITTLTDDGNYGLALALGGGGMKLLEETSAFSVFANDGIRNKTVSISNITNSKNEVIYNFNNSGQRVINAEIARKINSILSDNQARTPMFGPNNAFNIKDKNVAGKTGTTQDYRDAWTVGYTPSIAVGVWAGNNDNSPMRAGADGSYVAGPIWKTYMTKLLESKPREEFVAYQKIESETPMVSGASRVKKETIYYNIKSGKKISESKKNKTDPDKVKEETRVLDNRSILYYLNQDFNLRYDEEMIKRWEEGITGKNQSIDENK
ncbi:MAG: Penicillin-binding protein, 1A family [Candidatus Moranbacteria bacterium GW2011_GWE1_35_17]|nr:MAG: Penicillin-binding protein, 1A family [Candidatus Moranbacteria bacterium GW2011_GWE1_35_17]KKP83957.1 MAG: Penicillin-binding protein, 1A family [Candidatus Moranbacteria bacterium GW2011_GWF1_35_5]